MTRTRCTKEHIIQVLKEEEAKATVADLCRPHGMSEARYANWKVMYDSMTVSELRRLKSLEVENCRLRQIVAEQALGNRALKESLAKSF